ncbi:hypothetical protein [Natrinema sp. DC36]|uniref:hypothetical protein n=1 Tax=Natrinema sp. DC36 TaxID=2878680 RepID=UPI001CEFFB56|nr:hypothetical protein [Natrinema sp. DC36]
MTLKRRIRPLAGFATVLTLLALIVVDTIHPGVTFTLEDKALLISMISALLGVDIARDQLSSFPISWDQIPLKLSWADRPNPGTDDQHHSEGPNEGDGDD